MPIDFPVIIKKKGTVLPTDGIFFVIGSNGIFCRQQGPFFDRMVPVTTGLGFLEEIKTSVYSRLPPVPTIIIGKAKMFFRRVYQKMNAEAILLIFCNESTGEFDLECPEQTVHYSGVQYDPKSASTHSRRPGWLRIGSIHSHCNFGASHSGTDRHDELMFPGLHITIGHVDKDCFSAVSSYAFVNERFSVEPETVVAGLVPGQNGPMQFGGFYRLRLDNQDVRALIDHVDRIEEEWMPRVHEVKASCDFRNRRGFLPRAMDRLTRWWRDDRGDNRQPLAEVPARTESPVVQKSLFDGIPFTPQTVEEPPVVQGVPVNYPLALPTPILSLEQILEQCCVENVVSENKSGHDKPES